ncbi:MAG: hypothetical protein CMG52_05645 [Candidatus Marinimicrobia bacterium]|nr:hypothetical protein [Candidatus Neomarinimicrobiota bacterium]|tara:strand:+ start:787 stop:978 length:192 start_codon:yes stop_codon:yes gene_type:complete
MFKKIKSKKPTLNELIMGVYLESINKALISGKNPKHMFKRLQIMIEEQKSYRNSKKRKSKMKK